MPLINIVLESKLIAFEELSKFGSTENLNEQVKSLVEQQKVSWETAAKNYSTLKYIQTREFSFGHFKIKVHRQQKPMLKVSPPALVFYV